MKYANLVAGQPVPPLYCTLKYTKSSFLLLSLYDMMRCPGCLRLKEKNLCIFARIIRPACCPSMVDKLTSARSVLNYLSLRTWLLLLPVPTNMPSTKYEIQKGIRNGALAGLIAGLVLAVPMLATNTLDLSVLLPTTIVIGAIYGILTSNNSLRPSSTKEAVTLGIIAGLASFAVLSKPVAVPYAEMVVPILQYVLFGAVLGWMTSLLANRQERKIVTA